MGKMLQLAPSEGLTRSQITILESRPPSCPEERIDRLIDKGIAFKKPEYVDEAGVLLGQFSRSSAYASMYRIGYARQRSAYMETFRAFAAGMEPDLDQIERRDAYLTEYISALRGKVGIAGQTSYLKVNPLAIIPPPQPNCQ